MKKSTTTSHKHRLINIAIVAAAFLVGALLYFLLAVGISKTTPTAGAATGAWQQITVNVGACNCLIKFQPQPMLPGSGTLEDPFVSDNTTVGVLVQVNGSGTVTIEDGDGNILATYFQSNFDDPERVLDITFPNVGSHKLIVKINGDEVALNDVSTELYFSVSKLPSIPGIPNTGGYIYIAGYAVQTYSLLASGVIMATIAAFLLFRYRRRQHRADTSVKVIKQKPAKKR